MKLKLLRDIKPFGRTGEIVEVSPDRFDLLSLGLAVPVRDARELVETPEKELPAEKAAKPAAKKTAKKGK